MKWTWWKQADLTLNRFLVAALLLTNWQLEPAMLFGWWWFALGVLGAIVLVVEMLCGLNGYASRPGGT